MTLFSTGINQFAVDLHSFCKLSSAHREDYSSMEELTDITSNYLLSHSSVRSLTLKNVLVRIIEQWENLKKILPQFLTKVKRVQKICQGLKEVQKYRGAFEWSINTAALGLCCFSVKTVWNLSYQISIRKVTYLPVIQQNEHFAN